MAQITEYGKRIKYKLIDLGRSQKWLIDEVKKETGLFFDDSYLYKIMTGSLSTPSIVTAINAILAISDVP